MTHHIVVIHHDRSDDAGLISSMQGAAVGGMLGSLIFLAVWLQPFGSEQFHANALNFFIRCLTLGVLFLFSAQVLKKVLKYI